VFSAGAAVGAAGAAVFSTGAVVGAAGAAVFSTGAAVGVADAQAASTIDITRITPKMAISLDLTKLLISSSP
jgi:hypothetical protein